MYRRTRDALLLTLAVFVGGMMAVAFAAAYWHVVRADSLARHPLNPRSRLGLSSLQRGGIYARNGEVLAWSELEGGLWRRHYRVSMGLSHVIGYADERFGLSGIELALNEELSGRYAGGLPSWMSSLRGKRIQGADVRLTIEPRVQVAAERALGGRRGAVVAMDPRSGAILASVSYPGFSPAAVSSAWETLSTSRESPLLNRVTQGLYPPGSAFKVLTALAAIEHGVAAPESEYLCTGERKVDGGVIRDYQDTAHGQLDLTEATAVSCNYVFSGLGLALGPRRLEDAVRRGGLLMDTEFELPVSQDRAPGAGTISREELAELGIGQGRLAVSPLSMVRLVTIVARGGILVDPYLVEAVVGARGAPVWQHSVSQRRTFALATAQVVRSMLGEVVSTGTGRAAAVAGVNVAGKTGTAENPHGPAHAWFVGFAPLDAPRVAVAVVVENGGSGGQVAAPIASSVIRAALFGGNQR